MASSWLLDVSCVEERSSMERFYRDLLPARYNDPCIGENTKNVYVEKRETETIFKDLSTNRNDNDARRETR